MDNRDFPLIEYILICAGFGAMEGAVIGSVWFHTTIPIIFYLCGIAMFLFGIISFLPWTKK